MHVINTIDDFTNYALQVFNGYEEVQEVSFSDNMTFNIVLKGEEWDGNFDQRTAKILTSIYSSFSGIYSDILKQIPESDYPKRLDKNLRVTGKVKDGSLNFDVNIGTVLEVLTKMSTTQIIIIVAGVIVCFLGTKGITATVGYLKERNKELHDIEKLKLDNDATIEQQRLAFKTSQQMLETTLENSKDIISKSLTPYHTIGSCMSQDDTLYIPKNNIDLTKEDIKTEFAVVNSDLGHNYYVDSSFIIQMWKNVSENVATLCNQDGKISNAEIQLNDSEKTIFAKHLDAGTPIDLKVTVAVRGGKIDNAIILGIGEPREGAVALRDIIK